MDMGRVASVYLSSIVSTNRTVLENGLVKAFSGVEFFFSPTSTASFLRRFYSSSTLVRFLESRITPKQGF